MTNTHSYNYTLIVSSALRNCMAVVPIATYGAGACMRRKAVKSCMGTNLILFTTIYMESACS